MITIFEYILELGCQLDRELDLDHISRHLLDFLYALAFKNLQTRKQYPRSDSCYVYLHGKISSSITQAEFAMDFFENNRVGTVTTVMNLTKFEDGQHPVKYMLDENLDRVMQNRYRTMHGCVEKYLGVVMRSIWDVSVSELEQKACDKITAELLLRDNLKYAHIQNAFVEVVAIMGKKRGLTTIKDALTNNMHRLLQSKSNISAATLTRKYRNYMQDSMTNSLEATLKRLRELL